MRVKLHAVNTRFVVGDATRFPWSSFDGVYFYNPFEENLHRDDDPIDDTVELSKARLVADVRRVRAALLAAPVGMCVVTYNGYGGAIPAAYDLVNEEPIGTSWLRLWVKARPTLAHDGYLLESDEGVRYIGVTPRNTTTASGPTPRSIDGPVHDGPASSPPPPAPSEP